MKKLLRGCGILLIVCGIGIMAISGKAKEAAKPNEVHMGVIINGQFTETSSGYMGGNQEAEEDMSYLFGIGAIAALGGSAMAIGSFAVKEQESADY